MRGLASQGGSQQTAELLCFIYVA
jgi:hypothetical protein